MPVRLAAVVALLAVSSQLSASPLVAQDFERWKAAHEADKVANAAKKAADPRRQLATIKTAYITAADDLKDDRPVAACFKEHLTAQVPLEAVDSRETADIAFVISANNPPYAGRWIGKAPTGRIEAKTLDGKTIWSANVNPKGFGVPNACRFADQLLERLRDAMRKARQ